MPALDILIALLLAGGLVHGFMTGVIKQVASIVSIIAALLIGLQFMHPLGHVVTSWTGISEGMSPVVGFVVIFASVHLVVFFGVKLLETIVGVLQLGMANRVLGSAFGIFKAGIALSVAFLALGVAGFPGEQTQENSQLYGYVEPLLPQSWDLMREYFPGVEALKDKFTDTASSVMESDSLGNSVPSD
ncbi:MAG: CvpA family protein [Rhodothermales bacterium]|nr:CvpA family protein [Rhodothermales bacterium]